MQRHTNELYMQYTVTYHECKTGVAPGIFRRGTDSSDEGAKYGVQGTINTKNLRKDRFTPSDGVASMLRRGALALLWRHP